jgi:hypothetical protein
MQLCYVLWDNVSSLILPNGEIVTKDNPDFFRLVGQPPQAKLMLGLAGGTTFVANNLDLMRATHEIAAEIPDTEAVQAIAAILNAPPPEPEPTAEERIAAALEYQNMLTLP